MSRFDMPDGASQDHKLRPVVGLGLEQYGIHGGGRQDAGSLSLDRLRPADLSAVGRYR